MFEDEFNISKNELLISLYDGLDLSRNAAEYIMAWETLEKSPKDNLSLSLKDTAEIILKVDEEAQYKVDIPLKEGEGYMLASKPTFGEPTNHVWANGLVKNEGRSHSIFPNYMAKPTSSYKDHHFPYHEMNHPLRQINSHSGLPNMFEILRALGPGGYGKEEKDMERAWFKEMTEANSPLVTGYKLGKRNIPILGDINSFGTVGNHQYDLYERDFRRWRKENPQDESTTEDELRDMHFNDKVKEWSSKDGQLGLDGFMYGLEWLNPEERDSIQDQIDEGIDDKSSLTLPNGQKIPTARIAYNNLMRRTPEMNFMIRSNSHFGRNSNYRQQSNEEDYSQGENRFIQSAVADVMHDNNYYLDKPVSQYILDEINNKYVEEGKKPFERLPALNLHKEDFKDEYGLKDLRKGAKIPRLSMEDVLFLAGYDPNTNQPMSNHPIHGSMDGPIINIDILRKLEEEAKNNSTLQQKAKDMGNHRSFFTSPHGPHPDEEKPKYWRTDKDGFTYGPGKFYEQLYANLPGMNLAPATWMEMNHSTSHDKDTSSMFEMDKLHKQFFKPNSNNTILGMHFAPIETKEIGKFSADKMQFDYADLPNPMVNIFSPFATSKSSNLSDKNNYTEHKSSLNPMYEYFMRTASPQEKKELGSSNIHMASHKSHNPTISPMPETYYGSNPSDTRLHEKAIKSHIFNTFLGRPHHPFTPPKKAIGQLKEFLNGDLSISAGLELQEFKDYLNWDSKPMTYSNVKNTMQMKDYPTTRFINSVSKILGTKDARAINKFINNLEEDKNNENYKKLHDYYMNNHDFSAFDSINLEEAKKGLNGIVQSMHQEKKDKSNTPLKVKTTTLDGIHQILQFGGTQLSTEKENRFRETIDSINEMLLNPNLSQEDVTGLRDDMQQAVSGLNKVQQRKDKPSSHWKIGANQTLSALKAHHDTIVDYAKNVIMPLVIEQQPDAFDPSDPVKFIHNTQKLLADTQKHILSTNAHNLSTTNYGRQFDIKENKQLNEHNAIAGHLINNGNVIDGNMSVDEVINTLKLQKTPAMKEHVRNLLDESNKREAPLYVSTINDLLTNGPISKIGNADFSHMQNPNKDVMTSNYENLSSADKFHFDLHDTDLHEAIDLAQKRAGKEDENWKAHKVHAISQMLPRLLNSQQYGASMKNSGLELFHANDFDVHGVKNAGKGIKRNTFQTKNNLDSLVVLDERMLHDEQGNVIENAFMPQQNEIVSSATMTNTKIGKVNPSNATMYNVFGGGAIHEGRVASPTFGIETNMNGEPIIGENTQEGLYHTVSEEALNNLHGKDIAQQVLTTLPPPQNPLSAHQGINMETYLSPSDDPSTIAMSEISTYITSLLNPDVLLTKNDDAKWSPPIRPMHRIFELNDLEHMKGFSGSWVVSKWYDGKRIIIVNDDGITAYDENGKKVGLKKKFKENLSKLNERNYVIDGILGEDEINIFDVLNYDDNNVSDMLLHERMKLLRSQFDSHENIIIPGPHDTKLTDEEGLQDAVNSLQKEHEVILLRDSKSTYMKGERRHPKWMVLRKTKDYNFIILNVKGTSKYTYQLGAGPILDGSKLGNRAVSIKGNEYMDIGTIYNQKELYKVGDIVRVSITGITKKSRGGRNIFNVQMKEIVGNGEGEGAASAESLDILTKSFNPILIPHDIEYNNHKLKIILKDIDTVEYDVVQQNNLWYLENPHTSLSDLRKTSYPITLAESINPYWTSIAPLLFDGYLQKTDIEIAKPPSRKRQDKQSAGILDSKDDNRLLKPTTKKALEIISRVLDQLSKEKITWTGPKGLGIDLATPNESPSGPTRLASEETLPDYDGRKRSDEKEIQPKSNENEKKPIKHIEVSNNASQLSDFNKTD